MGRRLRMLVLTAGVLAAVLAGGCGPKIHTFSVEPRRACPDDSIRVEYRVAGSARVETTSDEGVPEIITYRLLVTRGGKTKEARQDVVRFHSGDTWPVVIATEPLGPDSLIARELLEASDWQSYVRLRTVSGQSNRPLWVSHGGVTAIIPGDGSPSEAFAGLSLAGVWEIRAALKSGEVQGDALRAPPSRLRLMTSFQCQRSQ